jgi:signal recognition particle subunit SRP72
METYVNMTSKKSGDPSSLAVATTNLISLKGTKDAADGLRKLDRLVEKSTAPNQLQLIESLEFKLSPRQKEALYSARVLLLLHANKVDQVCLAIIDPSPAYLFPYIVFVCRTCDFCIFFY